MCSGLNYLCGVIYLEDHKEGGRCNRNLKDSKSRERGFGRVCFKKNKEEVAKAEFEQNQMRPELEGVSLVCEVLRIRFAKGCDISVCWLSIRITLIKEKKIKKSSRRCP